MITQELLFGGADAIMVVSEPY